MEKDEPSQRLYSKIAAKYEDVFMPAILAENIIYDKIRAYDISGRVLDAGCGNGRWAKVFEKDDYVGVDINEQMLEQARKNHPYGRFLHADIRQIPYTDDYFDSIVSFFGVLSHLNVSQQKVAVSEMTRVLKPGGLMLITTGNFLSPFSIPATLRGGRVSTNGERYRIHNITHKKLQDMLSNTEILEMASYDFSFIPVGMIKFISALSDKDYQKTYSNLMDIYQETTNLPGLKWLGKQLYAVAKK